MNNISLNSNEEITITIPINIENFKEKVSQITIEGKYNNVVKKCEVELIGKKSNGFITAKQTMNITKDKIYDIEKVEFYTEIQNNSSEKKTVEYENSFSYRLNVVGSEIILDNQVIETIDSESIYTYITIPAEKSVIVKTTAYIERLDEYEEVVIKNKPTIGIDVFNNTYNVEVFSYEVNHY